MHARTLLVANTVLTSCLYCKLRQLELFGYNTHYFNRLEHCFDSFGLHNPVVRAYHKLIP
jgi:hypothetical protein